MMFCCCCYKLLIWSLKKNNNNKKWQSSGMRVAPKRDKLHSNDLKYIYICIYVSHTYASVYWDNWDDQLLMALNQIYPTFWINILQDLHGQSSHFQVLMRFLKRARESALQISIGTCCQNWLVRYGIAYLQRISLREGFLSGRCESFADCTYFLLKI